MSTESVTKRFNEMQCSPAEKESLQSYLFTLLSAGSNFRLKRNRVMIQEHDHKNKYVILDIVRTSVENEVYYLCHKCFPVSYGNFLSGGISRENFKTCIHSKICFLIWGGSYDIEVNIENEDDDEESDLIEVLASKPRYMAVVHPNKTYSKGPGVILISSKMLRPKCAVCSGQDSCCHLKIHLSHYNKQDDAVDANPSKRLKVDRVLPKNAQKKTNDGAVLDPFQHDGPASNVFKIRIDFLQSKTMESLNRNLDYKSFKNNFLVPTFDPEKLCAEHGNKFESQTNILNQESCDIRVHHLKKVDTSKLCVLFRPTVQSKGKPSCNCKDCTPVKKIVSYVSAPPQSKMTNAFFTLFLMNSTLIILLVFCQEENQ